MIKEQNRKTIQSKNPNDNDDDNDEGNDMND